MTFADVSFDGAGFSGDAVFRGATFAGSAGFSRAVFSGTALFDGAGFSGGANLREAVFSGDAGFGPPDRALVAGACGACRPWTSQAVAQRRRRDGHSRKRRPPPPAREPSTSTGSPPPTSPPPQPEPTRTPSPPHSRNARAGPHPRAGKRTPAVPADTLRGELDRGGCLAAPVRRPVSRLDRRGVRGPSRRGTPPGFGRSWASRCGWCPSSIRPCSAIPPCGPPASAPVSWTPNTATSSYSWTEPDGGHYGPGLALPVRFQQLVTGVPLYRLLSAMPLVTLLR
ncbi:pentapeptide repeat-containing protein [Streptomyces yangpuensis]|uniref:pentapeptide repeat-containing protein n=1 Tax=Streptomyces yangpuensis TaxID=1648182 RepID=UPI003644D021